jgi:uncharacterized protein YndB with AHSA1/START domain
MTTMTSAQGQFTQRGGRWELGFVRPLPHPPEKVWRALTEPEHLAAWFPADIHGERAAGAALRFVFRNDEGPEEDGEILTYDPPKALQYRWGEELLRFELEPDGDGCMLTFVNTFDESGKAARDAAGWHVCLDVLGFHLVGDKPPWEPMEHWPEVHAVYVARLGPEASTIGPPEGSSES